MQERIKEILSQERLSPARFAELVGVQRSSVSHIISGRNKPSLDFLQKILTHFEHISPDWLITGKGPYKRSEALSRQAGVTPKQSGTDGKIVFPSFASSAREEEKALYHAKGNNERATGKEDTSDQAKLPVEDKEPGSTADSKSNERISLKGSESASNSPRKIVKTLLFYDDNTFEAFFPSE